MAGRELRLGQLNVVGPVHVLHSVPVGVDLGGEPVVDRVGAAIGVGQVGPNGAVLREHVLKRVAEPRGDVVGIPLVGIAHAVDVGVARVDAHIARLGVGTAARAVLRGNPDRAVVRAVQGFVGRTQVHVGDQDVLEGVRVLRLERPHEAAREFLVDPDGRAPEARVHIVLFEHLQTAARDEVRGRAVGEVGDRKAVLRVGPELILAECKVHRSGVGPVVEVHAAGPHEGLPAGKDAGAAAELRAVVPKHVVVEPKARGPVQNGIRRVSRPRPIHRVVLLDLGDGRVARVQGRVVRDEGLVRISVGRIVQVDGHIDAEPAGEGQLVAHRPLVLHVEAGVERTKGPLRIRRVADSFLEPRRARVVVHQREAAREHRSLQFRILELLTGTSTDRGHRRTDCFLEVVNRRPRPVVVGEDVPPVVERDELVGEIVELVVRPHRNGVVAQEDVEVVGERKDLLLQEIHRGEGLSPQLNLSGAVSDVDCRERLIEVRVPVVLYALVASNQLVGVAVAEGAVQLHGRRLGGVGKHLVPAGEGDRLRTSAEGIGIDRLRIVVADAEAMILIDVPVELPEELVAVERRGLPAKAARVVPVANSVFDEGQQVLQVLLGLDGGPAVVLKSALERLRGGFVVEVEVDKEKQLVLDDGPAEAPHIALVAERRERGVGQVLGEVLIAILKGQRALKLVGPAARHGVDGAAPKVALGHVVRGNRDVELLDRVDADGRGAGLPAVGARGGEAEHVVAHRAVDEDRVVAVVLAGDRDGGPVVIVVAHDGLRRKARKVRNRAVDRRGRLHLLLGDVGREALSVFVEDRAAFLHDLHLI